MKKRDTGVPRRESAVARISAAVSVSLRTSTAAYLKTLKACTVDPTPEAVHDLRVSIRRMVIAIDVAWDLRRSPKVRRLRRALASALKTAGPLRDTQVHLELMRERLAEFPTCREFYEELEISETRGKTKMHALIDKGTFPGKEEFKALGEHVSPRHAATAIREAITDAVEASTPRLEHLATGKFEGLHRGRVASRDLRYALEIVRPVAELSVAKHLEALRILQEALGSFHDLEGLLERLHNDGEIPPNRRKFAASIERELHVRRAACSHAAQQFLGLGPVNISPQSSIPHASVYILRHAIAKPRGAEFPDDRVRPLTKRGRRRMTHIAESISALNLAADVVLTSPYSRAADTADILVEALPRTVKVRSCPWLAPTVSRAVAVTALSQFIREGKNVIVVGHEPALQELTGKLTGGRRRHEVLKKGGLRKIEFFSPDASRPGTVAWTLTPKQLTL